MKVLSRVPTRIGNRIIEAIEAFDPEQIDAEIRRAAARYERRCLRTSHRASDAYCGRTLDPQ